MLLLLLLVLLMLRMLLSWARLRATILELPLVAVLQVRLLLILMLTMDIVWLVSRSRVNVLWHRADLPLLHDGQFWAHALVAPMLQR